MRSSTACKPSSSVAPWTKPPLTPPPASHIEKPRLWWSRPLAPSEVGRAAELAAPDDQRLVEQAAGLQVRQQRGDRTVALLGMVAVLGDVGVVVPGLVVAVIDLDDPDAALDQAAGDQAGVGELAVAVRLARRFGFAGEVERLARLELHAEGHLQRRDAGLERLVVGRALPGDLGSALEQVELLALVGARQMAVAYVANDPVGVDDLLWIWVPW